MLKTLGYLNLGTFITGVIVLLAQLWFKVWSSNVFEKLTLSLIVLQIAFLVVWYFLREAKGTDDIRSGKMD